MAAAVAPPACPAAAPPCRRAPLFHAVCLLRPRQWIKNSFVLAPLLFAGRIGDGPSVRAAAAAAVLFCLAASWGYVVNDLLDRELDARHAVKRVTRPVAAGNLAPRAALWILAGLSAAIASAVAVRPALAVPIGAYLLVALAYSVLLKHVAVVDLLAVAACFGLRVYGGAHAIGVPLSAWMLVTTLALSVYLAALKRREEIVMRGESGRPVLRTYTPATLDGCALMAGACAITSYCLYVLVERPALAPTVPLVLLGLLRYRHLAGQPSALESPTDSLLSDLPLALTVLTWVASCVYLFAA